MSQKELGCGLIFRIVALQHLCVRCLTFCSDPYREKAVMDDKGDWHPHAMSLKFMHLLCCEEYTDEEVQDVKCMSVQLGFKCFNTIIGCGYPCACCC